MYCTLMFHQSQTENSWTNPRDGAFCVREEQFVQSHAHKTLPYYELNWTSYKVINPNLLPAIKCFCCRRNKGCVSVSLLFSLFGSGASQSCLGTPCYSGWSNSYCTTGTIQWTHCHHLAQPACSGACSRGRPADVAGKPRALNLKHGPK